MQAPSRLRWTYGGVAILCVTMAPAVQSCAVMSSTSDCASKADCPVDDASGATSSSSSGNIGSSSSGSGGSSSSSGGSEGGPATGDDEGDATLADVSSEATPLDVRGDAVDGTLADVVGDVTSEDSTARDVANEPPVDAARDVADVTGPTGDGCTATVENCTNGVDDSCDGKIDCADPACSSFTCVAQVPAGWTGPALLWLGGSTATAPACPTGYQTALDGHEGPTGGDDGCTCVCGAGGQVCSATGSFHNDMTCSASTCVAGTVSSASGCTNVAANTCGIQGSFEIGAGAVPAPTGGTCTPQTTTTPGPAPGWTTTARVCAWAGANDTPGGCSPTTDRCVGGSPGAGAGFAATLCVFESGAVACPAAYPNNQNVVFSGESDTRTCAGCACTTGAPTGGSCAGTVTLFGGANCTGSTGSYTLGTACVTYAVPPQDPASLQAAFTVTPGSCTVGTQPSPTGTVTGTGPTTVCCM